MVLCLQGVSVLFSTAIALVVLLFPGEVELLVASFLKHECEACWGLSKPTPLRFDTFASFAGT